MKIPWPVIALGLLALPQAHAQDAPPPSAEARDYAK